MKVIRIHNVQEAPEIVHLFDAYRQYFKQLSNVVEAEKYLATRLKNSESIILIAKEEGMAIGFTQLYPGFSSIGMKPIWTLNDLFVLEKYRNSGAGKKLLSAASDLGKSLGWRGMKLETAHNNEARRLYEREGWMVDEEFLHYSLYF